jgi:hypothetical protein
MGASSNPVMDTSSGTRTPVGDLRWAYARIDRMAADNPIVVEPAALARSVA